MLKEPSEFQNPKKCLHLCSTFSEIILKGKERTGLSLRRAARLGGVRHGGVRSWKRPGEAARGKCRVKGLRLFTMLMFCSLQVVS